MSNYAELGRTPPHAIMRDDPPPIVLIKEEHQMFRELFDRVESAEGDALIGLAGEIGARLIIHMKIEEEILYPALKESSTSGKWTRESSSIRWRGISSSTSHA